LTAQLVKSARAAAGMAGAVLGASYLLRAVGDASEGEGLGWLSWPSPVGWYHQARPYAGDRLWVLLLLLGLSAAVIALAYALEARRDFAAGLLPDRPGRATAAPGLRNPLALAWRLQRGTLLTWTIVFIVVGFVVGGLASNVGDFLESPEARELIEKLGGMGTLTDMFLAVELGFSAVFASVFGIQAVMRLRSEESGLRAEPVLATAVGRTRWAWSHLTLALVGVVVLLAAVGLSAGLARAMQEDDIGQLGRILVAALVQIPAVWVMIGIVMAAFGVVPRFVFVGWIFLVGFMLLGELGPLFELDRWVMDISPFANVPKLPGGDLTVAPLLWLTAIAAGLVALGLTTFRRRDLG
jgi:ABC-2 type transport system permease protein